MRLCLLLILCLAASVAAQVPKGEELKWHRSLDVALKASQVNDRPVLVYVFDTV